MNKYIKLFIIFVSLFLILPLLNKVEAYDYKLCDLPSPDPEYCSTPDHIYDNNPSLTPGYKCEPLPDGTKASIIYDFTETDIEYWEKTPVGATVCGYHCFAEDYKCEKCTPVRLLKTGNMPMAGTYKIGAWVARGHEGQLQTGEEFHVVIGGVAGNTIRDDKDPSAEVAEFLQLGTFPLQQGLNTIYQVSDAPACSNCYGTSGSASCKPNSAHILKLCVYLTEPACVLCDLMQCKNPVTSNLPVNPPAPHPISEYELKDLYYCEDPVGCPDPRDHYNTCYEILSPQPEVNLKLHPEIKETTLGFVSKAYTGGGQYKIVNGEVKDDRVNDGLPIEGDTATNEDEKFYMKASFTDKDQRLEALYVWLSKSNTKPVTPKRIDTDNVASEPDTKSDQDFGFMLYKVGRDWVPYIGGGNSTFDAWVKADYLNNRFAIKRKVSAANYEDMVYVYLNQADIQTSLDGKSAVVSFSISFKDPENSSKLLTVLEQGKYNVWMMANDVFGFTPYDNYDNKKIYPDEERYNLIRAAIHNKWISEERIRYHDQWVDTGRDWNIDLTNPGITWIVEPSPVSKTAVRVKWLYTDNLGFSSSVLNMFKSDDLEIPSEGIRLIGSDLNGATNVDDSHFPLKVEPEGNLLNLPNSSEWDNFNFGSLIYDENTNPYALKFVGGGGVNEGYYLDLDLSDIGQGFLHFYLTAFDKGGNVAEGKIFSFDTRDWIVTYGGLLYSIDGSQFPVRTDLDSSGKTEWNNKALLKTITFENATLSSELIGEMDLLETSPVSPKKSDTTLNYHIPKYNIVDRGSYYDSLKAAFEFRKSYLEDRIVPLYSLGGSLGLDDNQIGLIDTAENEALTVPKSFVCDGRMVAFVDGNLTIDGRIENGDMNEDACIFVVKGSVTINQDGNYSSNTVMEYDEVNAYILSDGNIDIKFDNNHDGLFVGGGMHSLLGFNPIKRNFYIQDRLRYPVFVVKNHSKYGVFAEELFGKEVTLQKVEVGVK